MVEVGQRIQKPRRGIAGNPPCMGADRRVEKQGVGICRLESADIERQRKIIGKNPLADADRAVERIIVEKVAAAARRERRLIAKRRQPVRKAVVESADAALEKKIGIGAEAGAGKAGQQAEFGLPRSAAENIDVEAAIERILRRQKGFDNRFDRKPVDARIEDRFVLDHDDVGIVEAARRYGRGQRQRIAGRYRSERGRRTAARKAGRAGRRQSSKENTAAAPRSAARQGLRRSTGRPRPGRSGPCRTPGLEPPERPRVPADTVWRRRRG